MRPVATPIACALVPLVTARIARALTGVRPRGAGARAMELTQLALAWIAGATALGPALVGAPSGPPIALFAATCAAVACVAGSRTRRDAGSRLLAIAPPMLAASAALLVLGRSAEALVATGAGSAALTLGIHRALACRLGGPAERDEPSAGAAPGRASLVAGATIALVLACAAAAAASLTSIAPEDAPTAGDAAARWRLRIDPWDPIAMIAAGWAVRETSGDRALAWAREAVRLGAPESLALELEAEVYAAKGECERARASFDRSLAARAREAFEDPLARPLELGGYHLPPSLLAGCRELSDP